MPTPTYDLIDSQVLSTSASSVTFSSIPATYRDLVLVVSGTSSLARNVQVKINNDSGANYNYVVMAGDGSSAQTDSGSGQTTGSLTSFAQMNATAEAIFISQFLDYSATDKHKTYLTRGNNSSGAVSATAGRWASTAAITTLELYVPSATFDAGNTFYLYGIAA